MNQSAVFHISLGLGLGLGLGMALVLGLGLGLPVSFSQIKNFDSCHDPLTHSSLTQKNFNLHIILYKIYNY